MEVQLIQRKIYEIRGQKVMLDADLAELYEVPTKALNQAVKRNIERFPEDFMFQLTQQEWQELRLRLAKQDVRWSQIVTTPNRFRRETFAPYAFSEQGVAMLSGVLRSTKSIQTNIAIMRAFVALRRYALSFDEIAAKVLEHDKEIADIHEALRQLAPDEKGADAWENRPRIGFKKPEGTT